MPGLWGARLLRGWKRAQLALADRERSRSNDPSASPRAHLAHHPPFAAQRSTRSGGDGTRGAIGGRAVSPVSAAARSLSGAGRVVSFGTPATHISPSVPKFAEPGRKRFGGIDVPAPPPRLRHLPRRRASDARDHAKR